MEDEDMIPAPSLEDLAIPEFVKKYEGVVDKQIFSWEELLLEAQSFDRNASIATGFIYGEKEALKTKVNFEQLFKHKGKYLLNFKEDKVTVYYDM